jgi:hypothetical protein
MWILILNSSWIAKPPAVIGGFKTLDEAEASGDLATHFWPPTEDWGPGRTGDWTSYTIVPMSEPADMVYCKIAVQWDAEVKRDLYKRFKFRGSSGGRVGNAADAALGGGGGGRP